MKRAAFPTFSKTLMTKTDMTLQQALDQLESLANETTRKHNKKWGAGENQFGVPHGEIRKLAAKIKTDHELALQLWQTGNLDAQLLAVLLMDSKRLSRAELDRVVKSTTFAHVADWLNSYVVKHHADKEALREKWLKEKKNRWAARAGWSLTSERISKSPEGLDLAAILDRLEAEMGDAAPEVQWTMNACLAGIGIHHPQLRKRAIAIGEKLGVLRDYPVSKGCTSPFAPIWIAAMVKRQK